MSVLGEPSMREWLDGLKAGDEVAEFSGRDNVPQIGRVARVTATQIIVGQWRYRRKTGHMVGASVWSSSRITRPTQEHRDLAERRALRRRMEDVVKVADLNTLRALARALEGDTA